MIGTDVLLDFIAHIQSEKQNPCSWRRVIDRLPPHPDYREALHDGELDCVVRHFMPHLQTAHHIGELLQALYNPLQIESLARELSVDCPPGYSETEMRIRGAATDPCQVCRAPIKRYGRFRTCHECLRDRHVRV